MLFTVRLNLAELASAFGVEKMDIEEMQPKVALALQSVFVSLILLSIKWIRALFCGVYARSRRHYHALQHFSF